MFQLRRYGATLDRADVLRLKAEFEERQCVLLSELLDPDLLTILQSRISSCEWQDRTHRGVGVELVTQDAPALGVLHLLANSAQFVDAVREISGCADLNWFGGRVYQMIPNAGHFDSWHTDCFDPRRRIAMSLNLSRDGYEGGVLQLRERESRRMIAELANTGFGDAILFRLATTLEHQVTEVVGAKPKIAFAGWFHSGANDFLAMLDSSD